MIQSTENSGKYYDVATWTVASSESSSSDILVLELHN